MTKSGYAVLCVAAIGAGFIFAAPASAMSLKDCNAEWSAMKANKTVGDTKYADFRKECLARPAAATGTPPAATESKPAAPKAAAAPAAEPGAKPTGGREAFYARERACGAEWKADKAAGKVPAGQKWPQFLHECNARKKSEGL